MDAPNVPLEDIPARKQSRFVPAAEKRVLVVDDNPDSAETVALLLRSMGHIAATALDARTAMDSCRRERADVVLLDLMLPDLDGYEVARRLREEHGAGLRIIAVTGMAGDEIRSRCLEAGFDYYILKPIDPAFLKSLLG